ncbi:MAG: cytochrome c family protein [Bacteroidales bacterium]|nr:cytochrome c family protein [Bacteroidales bacterium]
MKSLLIACFFLFLGGNYLTAQDYDYIGAAKCKMCHNKATTGAQYKIWAESKHATAMESLKGDEKTDPKCLKCHSTAGSVDASLIATLKVEEGVSCESCHGAGSGYKSKTVMQDQEKAIAKGLVIPNEQTCLKCHNDESPNFKGFNYDEYWKKIAHPVPASE